MAACATCGRPLGLADDPLSTDCGGDCWGCVGQIEADGGEDYAFRKVSAEIAAGFREEDGTPKPYEGQVKRVATAPRPKDRSQQ